MIKFHGKKEYFFFKKSFLFLIRPVAAAPNEMCFMVSTSNFIRRPSLDPHKVQDPHYRLYPTRCQTSISEQNSG